MEMVDLYDENRLPLGRTAERYAPKGEGEYRVVVHICVFDSRGRLLIQQRSREKAVWPEAWDVSAAGGVDAGETSRQAAEREFREELGVALDLTGVRPSCTVNFDGGFDDFFLVERDLGLEELTLQKEEVAGPVGRSCRKSWTWWTGGSSSTIPKAFWRFCSTCGGPSASAPNEAPPGPKLQCFFGKRP